MGAIKDLTGRVFERLTVVKLVKTEKGHTHWECICECGKTSISTSCNLIRGNTRSCGCLKLETTATANKTHGMSSHPIYNVWRAMLNRCNDPKNIMYHRYGARGIQVCGEWFKFENFMTDMGVPTGKMDIDRIDNDKGYSKANCKWSTRTENSRNKANSIKIEWNGSVKTLPEWSEIYGLHYKCLYKRFRLGWDAENMLLTPSGGA